MARGRSVSEGGLQDTNENQKNGKKKRPMRTNLARGVSFASLARGDLTCAVFFTGGNV